MKTPPVGMFFDNWSINDSAPYLQENALAGLANPSDLGRGVIWALMVAEGNLQFRHWRKKPGKRFDSTYLIAGAVGLLFGARAL